MTWSVLNVDQKKDLHELCQTTTRVHIFVTIIKTAHFDRSCQSNTKGCDIQGSSSVRCCDWVIKHGNPPPHALAFWSVSPRHRQRLLSPVVLHPFGFGHIVLIIIAWLTFHIPCSTSTQPKRQEGIYYHTHVRGTLEDLRLRTSQRWPLTRDQYRPDGSSNANKRHDSLIVRRSR